MEIKCAVQSQGPGGIIVQEPGGLWVGAVGQPGCWDFTLLTAAALWMGGLCNDVLRPPHDPGAVGVRE